MWSAHVPGTPAKGIKDAIDGCATDPAEEYLGTEHRAQLAAAREAAKALVDAKVVDGEEFEIVLGGHADVEGHSQAGYVHVQVTQWPPKETTPHGFNAATQSFDAPEEE